MPSEWAKELPRDWTENVRYRKELRRACKNSPYNQRRVTEVCRRDILFWINSFVWQFNPNIFIWKPWEPGVPTQGEDGSFSFHKAFQIERGEPVGPFLTWGFQDRAIEKIEQHIVTGEDLVIEKAREMGASWINIMVLVWHWLYQSMSKFLLISRNIEAVDDKGDPDSLLWKFDFIVRRLPHWMRPRYSDPLMLRGNIDNGAVVNGQASTGKAGVGGRATGIFVDEYSLIREAREVYSHTADTGACRIFNFTHRGTAPYASELAKKKGVKKIQMHWTEHPEKNKGLYHYSKELNRLAYLTTDFSYPPDYPYILDGTPSGGPCVGIRNAWYDYAVTRQDSAQAAAMNYDINPEGSMEQFFDPILLRELIAECRGPSWQGDIELDPQTAQITRFIQRKNGPLKLWLKLDGQGRPPKSRYFIGGDISSGQGVTPTCFPIFDGRRGEKVAEYVNPFIDPIKAGDVMVGLGRLFVDEQGRGAKLLWEACGPGLKTGERIKELNYFHVYMRSDELRIDPKISTTPGWFSDKTTKMRLLLDYRDALRTREYMNVSEPALRECSQFRFEAGEVVHDKEKSAVDSAARVSHGDYVIADALSWKGAKLAGCERVKEKQKKVVPILSLQWRRDYNKRQEDLESA